MRGAIEREVRGVETLIMRLPKGSAKMPSERG